MRPGHLGRGRFNDRKRADSSPARPFFSDRRRPLPGVESVVASHSPQYRMAMRLAAHAIFLDRASVFREGPRRWRAMASRTERGATQGSFRFSTSIRLEI